MAIMEKVYALPKLNRWGHRFAVVDPQMGNATLIIDGTVEPSRADESQFGKKKGKGNNFQVLLCLDAGLCDYSGPFIGKRNDSAVFGDGQEDGDPDNVVS